MTRVTLVLVVLVWSMLPLLATAMFKSLTQPGRTMHCSPNSVGKSTVNTCIKLASDVKKMGDIDLSNLGIEYLTVNDYRNQPMRIGYKIFRRQHAANTVIYTGGILERMSPASISNAVSMTAAAYDDRRTLMPNVIVFDFPGKGASTGEFSRENLIIALYEIAQFARQLPIEGIGAGSTIRPTVTFMGYCFGVGPSVEVAARMVDENRRSVSSLILIAAYGTFEDFDDEKYLPARLGWFQPVQYADIFKSNGGQNRIPTFFFHGNKDKVVPLKNFERFALKFMENQEEMYDLVAVIAEGDHHLISPRSDTRPAFYIALRRLVSGEDDDDEEDTDEDAED